MNPHNTNPRLIYADYNASSPINEKVKFFLQKRINGNFANPNAIHAFGKSIKSEIESSRETIADLIGSNPEQVIFTSGSTEGISTIFHQFYLKKPFCNDKKNCIISSQLEHSAVIKNISSLKAEDLIDEFNVTCLNSGIIDTKHAKDLIERHKNKVGLISLMSVNNEIGTIQPIEELIEIANFHKIPFFADTTQHIGRIPFHFHKSQLDFAVLSGHKLGAPLGIGVLLCRNPEVLSPLILGGNQEMYQRGGTQNFLGIIGLSLALEDHLTSSTKFHEKWSLLENEKMEFEKNLKNYFPDLVIYGDSVNRIANTTCLSFPLIHGQAIQIECESRNIFFTTSSACSDNEPETSKILKAMGINDSLGRGTIRISTGQSYKKGDYDIIFNTLKDVIKKLSFANQNCTFGSWSAEGGQ